MSYDVREGAHSVADGVALCRPEIIASNPIIPQTHIMERLALLVAQKKLDADYVNVESQSSALSLMAGATACGVRSFTATSSQGLATMHESLHSVAGMRLPTTMIVTNRALSTPTNIWSDHSDSMSQRDTSWLQFYAETVQEALDLTIQSYRIAESKDVLLPAMVCMDGYLLTHSYEPVDIPSQSDVDDLLPPLGLDHKLDTEKPLTLGPFTTPDEYMEFKYEQKEAMDRAKTKIKDVNKEFGDKFGRSYGDGLTECMGKDYDLALVAAGSICGTLKDVAEDRCGLIKIRSYRPFPIKELRKTAKNFKALGVIDQSFSYGFHGQLFSEVKSTVDVPVKGFVAGLGGRDIRVEDVEQMISGLESYEQDEENEDEVEWINLKDKKKE
ncbi:MAG: pyruvate ferredoxin oxidoreductase [Archaeoglobaceae archaeon]